MFVMESREQLEVRISMKICNVILKKIEIKLEFTKSIYMV